MKVEKLLKVTENMYKTDLIFVRIKAEFRFFFRRILPFYHYDSFFYSIFNTSDFADFRFFVVLVKSGLIKLTILD